jgi:hypothetical protein
MSPEKTNILYKDFPLLYRDRVLPESVSRMCDGFCCGSGWFSIIYNLSKELDAVFVDEMRRKPSFEYPSVFQVKEKYGTLSYYINGNLGKAHEIISKWEIASSATCEDCGSTNGVAMRQYGIWISTRCEVCHTNIINKKGI